MTRRKLEYDSMEDDEYGYEYSRFEDSFNSLWSESFSGTQFHVNDHRRRQYDTNYSSGGEFLREILDGIDSVRLDVSFDDGLCGVTVYSHDNPTGGTYEVVEA